MPIPSVIYQTFAHDRLPWQTRWAIAAMRRRNPSFDYQFYDDDRILDFFDQQCPESWGAAYRRIAIGAAKADFFRYAILCRFGGIYLDIDSGIDRPLASFIRPDDAAIIAPGKHPGLYVQWALLFEPGHPFLVQTIDDVLDNITHNRHPHDVHRMTGPTVYSRAIDQVLARTDRVPYRCTGRDFDGVFRFKRRFRGRLYTTAPHWRVEQTQRCVLHPLK